MKKVSISDEVEKKCPEWVEKVIQFSAQNTGADDYQLRIESVRVSKENIGITF